MELGLTGRVVVITGAGRGIGAQMVSTFAKEGAVVVSLDIAGGQADASLAMQCDVTDPADVASKVKATLQQCGRIDVLVNNAGVVAQSPVESMHIDAWKRVFDVNVHGVFNTCQAVIPAMKSQRWGRILNAASFAAIIPTVGGAAYAASKAAVVQFSRVLAGELGPWGITVNSYAPGMVPTTMNAFADLDEPAAARKLDQLTIRRWGTAEEVADAVCFLASDRASYVTGSLFEISGGKLATQAPSDAYINLAQSRS